MSVKMGTIYACNLGHDRDQICLQFQCREEPYMPAIVSVGDHICLQCRKFLKFLESDRLRSKHFFKKIDNAGIFGPQQNCYCRLIWSLRYLINLWYSFASFCLTRFDMVHIIRPILYGLL